VQKNAIPDRGTRIGIATLLAITGSGFISSVAAAAPPAADDPRRAAEDELIVAFDPGASPADREAAEDKVHAVREERLVPGSRGTDSVYRVDLPAGASNATAIRTLERDPDVAYAEPNWLVEPTATSNDPYYTGGSLWGMYGDATSPANQYGSHAGEAWAAGHLGSSSTYVGVIDEGCQWSHPDLDGNVGRNPFDPVDGSDNDGNGYTDDSHGWNFYDGNNNVYYGGTSGSEDDHGTHVNGTIAAEGGNATGVAGVSWNTQTVCAKFLGPGGGYTSDAILAVDYFTRLKQTNNADLIATNNSWGGGGYSQGLHDAIIRGAKAGILFVAAAGNDGRDNDSTANWPSNYDTTKGTTTENPANYDAVIAVAAISSSGSRPSWSNYGATSVDLGAPGSSINSTLPYNGYGSYSGTSMATPHVTGAAALYKSMNPDADAATVKNAILESARNTPTSSLNGRTVTGGRLDISKLQSGGSPPPPPPPPPAPTTAMAYPGGTGLLENSGLRSGNWTYLGPLSPGANPDDNRYYAVNSTSSGTRISSWYGEFGGVPADLTKLDVLYRGKNSRSATQTVAIWNWVTGAWDQLGGAVSVSGSEATLSRSVPGNLGDYVLNGTLRVRARATRSSRSFYSSGDVLRIVFTRP
jgi:subtilisin family serine protease